jgi:hypothetical protein
MQRKRSSGGRVQPGDSVNASGGRGSIPEKMALPKSNAIVCEKKCADAPEGSGRALGSNREADKGLPVKADDDLAICKL